MRKYLLLILTVLLLIHFRLTFAGACMCSTEEYLGMLTTAEVNDTSSMHNETLEALYCIHHWTDYLVMGYEYFATPGALDKVEKMTQPYREKVYQLVPKYLESEVQQIREQAAGALAYYKWPNCFECLMKCERTSISKKCVLFAILGDKRAIPIVIKYYWELERKYKTKPQFSYPDKMNCLNALYHLASPEILPFVDSIIENPKPLKIKKRAEKVKNRILELYPDDGIDLSTGNSIDLDSIFGVQLTEEDKVDIYRKTLDIAIVGQKLPCYEWLDFVVNQKHDTVWIISNENLETWLIPEVDYRLIFFDQKQLQQRADSIGNFMYIYFDHPIELQDSIVSVHVSTAWATHHESSIGYKSFGGLWILFNKIDGGWTVKKQYPVVVTTTLQIQDYIHTNK